VVLCASRYADDASRVSADKHQQEDAMAIDFWGRLDLAIKAMSASWEARMAELQALQTDPDSFVLDGAVWLNHYNNFWRHARLSGNSDSLKLSYSGIFFAPSSTFVLPRDRIRRLYEVWIGRLRIEHTVDSCPEYIAFRPSFPGFRPAHDFAKLKSELTRLGYDIGFEYANL
jgi:hypothetical protein